MATTKTSPPGSKRLRRSGGYVFLSMIIGFLIAGLSFSTVAGSIALLVKNTATIKVELLQGIEHRNAAAIDKKVIFEKED